MTIAIVIILLAVLCLAYANGANDNFKGVATLFGSGTTNYRRALTWATVTTFFGSLTAIWVATTLIKAFSGKGLVDAELITNSSYSAAVALGAGLTVLIATRIGMPISTTHALVGALIGAGLAAGSTINFGVLTGKFFLPLLVSPVIAVVVTSLIYPLLRMTRKKMGVTAETCLCVGNETVEVIPSADIAIIAEKTELLTVQLGNQVTCHNRYQGEVLGLNASTVLDRMHYLSAGMVCFARGLNDTPKIAALLLVAPFFGQSQSGTLSSVLLVGVIIAIGGILSARKVAETMSLKITTMNHGQGFTANFISGIIIIFASKFGMPVSTTHVSCGSLFGIGMVTKQGHTGMIGKVLGAWAITLPIGAVLGAACYWGIGLM